MVVETFNIHSSVWLLSLLLADAFIIRATEEYVEKHPNTSEDIQKADKLFLHC